MTRLGAEVRHLLVSLGYRLRPYDMLLDRRRWRWQARGRCGLPVGMPQPPGFTMPQLDAAIARYRENVNRSSCYCGRTDLGLDVANPHPKVAGCPDTYLGVSR